MLNLLQHPSILSSCGSWTRDGPWNKFRVTARGR